MNNLPRYCQTRMNLLETSVQRFNQASEYLSENELTDLAEILEKIDYDRLTRIVDRAHALRVQSEPRTFMDIVYQARQRLGVNK